MAAESDFTDRQRMDLLSRMYVEAMQARQYGRLTVVSSRPSKTDLRAQVDAVLNSERERILGKRA